MPKQWKAKVRQAEEKGKHSRWRERHRQRRSKNENVSMKPEQLRDGGSAGGWEPARRGRGASGGAVPRRAGWRRSALRGFKGWLWTGALGRPEGTVDDGAEAAERRGRGRTCGRVGHACELIDSGRPHLKQLWAVLCARKRATQPLLTPNHPPPRYQPYGGCSVAFAKSKGYVLKCNIYFFLQF